MKRKYVNQENLYYLFFLFSNPFFLFSCIQKFSNLSPTTLAVSEFCKVKLSVPKLCFRDIFKSRNIHKNNHDEIKLSLLPPCIITLGRLEDFEILAGGIGADL